MSSTARPDCQRCGARLTRDIHTRYYNGTTQRHLECYTCNACGAKGHTITTHDGKITGRQGPACQPTADVRNPEVQA